MATFTVMIDDNFDYMDEDARSEFGVFTTAAEAISACKQIVDADLSAMYKPGMNAAELYNYYTSFGSDPFIVTGSPGERVDFSAWTYAKGQSEMLCSHPVQPGELADPSSAAVPPRRDR